MPLTFIREQLKTMKEIVEILASLLSLVKNRPSLFVIALTIYLLYLGIGWWAYKHPGHVVSGFTEAVSKGNHEVAWSFLTKNYRERRFENLEKFKRLYSIKFSTKGLSTEIYNHERSRLMAIFDNTKKYTIKYEATERFTRKDLQNPEQKINALWLQIHHTRDFPALMDGTLQGQDLGSNPSLAIRRRFEQVFEITRQRRQGYFEGFLDLFVSQWEISSINIVEQCLLPLQDKK